MHLTCSTTAFPITFCRLENKSPFLAPTPKKCIYMFMQLSLPALPLRKTKPNQTSVNSSKASFPHNTQ